MTLPKTHIFVVSNLLPSDVGRHIEKVNKIRNQIEKKNNSKKL